MTSPTPKPPTKSAATNPTRPCPACSRVVPAADINPNMVTAAVGDRTIDEARLRRRARRAGDIEEALRLRRVAGQVRDEAPEAGPEEGDDTCPACRTENVAVNEAKLSDLGRRMLARSRQEANVSAIDQIREAKSAKGRAEMAETNRKRAVAREGLRRINGGRWGA